MSTLPSSARPAFSSQRQTNLAKLGFYGPSSRIESADLKTTNRATMRSEEILNSVRENIDRMLCVPEGDPNWERFTRVDLGLPDWMSPAVRRTVQMRAWRRSKDPLKSLADNAQRCASRLGLKPT